MPPWAWLAQATPAHHAAACSSPIGFPNVRSIALNEGIADGVWLAEFSALADHGLVPATVAAAVGLELGGGEVSAQRVAQALADRRLLLA
jgi:predicted ATPase